MSDSEYDSEDDDDYVPEETTSDEEDIGLGGDEEKGKTKKTKKGQTSKRKRKGGIKLDDEEPAEEVSSNDEEINYVSDDLEKSKKILKSRENDLWASFKKDTAAVVSTTNIVSSETECGTKDVKDLKAGSTQQGSKNHKPVPTKIEITEIYDFAGEEVKVVKSVDASSHQSPPNTNEQETKESPGSDSKTKPAVLPMKRSSGGLGSVLGKISKKPKLSTLDKSKLDWQQFKKQEGIEDDLKTSNKDGYLEKQAFLNRVDHKQFAIERNIRESVRKR